MSYLTPRMRRFANDTLGPRGIEFRFESPCDVGDTRIGADVRREVFLIFKEAVNNLARHSECSSASFSLQSHGGTALLKVSDNGKGFAVEGSELGTGARQHAYARGKNWNRVNPHFESRSRNYADRQSPAEIIFVKL